MLTVPESLLHTPPDCRVCAIIVERAQARGEDLCACPAQMIPHRRIKGVCPERLAKAA